MVRSPFGAGAGMKTRRLAFSGPLNVGMFNVAAQTNGTLAGAVADQVGVVAAHSGADNDLSQVTLNVGKVFKLAAGCKGWIKMLVRLAHTSHQKFDAYAGLTSGPASGTGVFSNTAATLSSQDALMFYTLEDSAFWRAAHINAAAIDTDVVSAVAEATATDYSLGIEFEGLSSGLLAKFKVNGTLIRTVTDKSYTSYDEMFLSFGCKSTASTNVSSITLKALAFDINMGGL